MNRNFGHRVSAPAPATTVTVRSWLGYEPTNN